MYTKGIRKIFTSQRTAGTSLNKTMDDAIAAGFTVLTFNGDIYVTTEVGNLWIKTAFELSDFTDEKD